MDLRRLGSSGALVSELSLGTMTFGAETDEPEAHAILDAYVEGGGTFIDTADIYTNGRSEEIIGSWLARRQGRAADLVIATKSRNSLSGRPQDGGLSRVTITRAVDASLQRLGVEVIDLHQMHCWDPSTPIEETLDAYADLIRAGKIRYVGASNFTGWQLQRAVLVAPDRAATPITLQPQYNLLAREIELELVPLCLDEGLGLLPWSPLGGGWLTGKYSRDEHPGGATRLGEDPERGVEAWAKRDSDRTWAIVDAVREVADDRGVTMSQVALNWVNGRPGVSSTILGVRTVAQLEDNLGAVGWRLDDGERERLDAVSVPWRPDYPYGFIDDGTSDLAAYA